MKKELKLTALLKNAPNTIKTVAQSKEVRTAVKDALKALKGIADTFDVNKY